MMLEAVEGSRQFLDSFFSDDEELCFNAIQSLRNLVIGSNRTKSHVIECGMVPHLLRRLADTNVTPKVQVEILVTLGSLAKGTRAHAHALLDCNILPLLIDGLRSSCAALRPPLLRCLRSLLLHVPECAEQLGRHPAAAPLLAACTAGRRADAECAATVLAIMCQSAPQQDSLASHGVPEVASALLAADATTTSPLPALRLLGALSYRNAAVAERIANCTVPDGGALLDVVTALTSRGQSAPVQLEAARLLAHLHRAGAAALPAADRRLVFGALPGLVRLCGGDQPAERRAAAADTLAYLIEVDVDLQRICSITDHVIATMRDFLRFQPTTSHPKTRAHQRLMAAELKKAAFKVYASLASNNEQIRKRVVETAGVLPALLTALQAEQPAPLQLAALRCLLSLSRSVQTLRTALQDHPVWRPVLELARNPASSLDVRVAASSVFCNLMLEFSPSKHAMMQSGAVDLLCELARSEDADVRLNGIWALMNTAYQAGHKTKSAILQRLGTNDLFRLLSDPSAAVLKKTLGLLRNLLTRPDVDQFMEHGQGTQIMQAIVLTLEGDHAFEVKEQALCILANIADGGQSKDFIMGNEDVLRKLQNYMVHVSPRLRHAAVLAVANLVWRGEDGCRERQSRLRRLGLPRLLQTVPTADDPVLAERVKCVLQQFT